MVATPALLPRNNPLKKPGFDSYEEYHPYGTTAWQAPSLTTVSLKRYKYTGMERDEETGLQRHGVRYYATWLGRWTSADPIGLGDGGNIFAYCGGRPVGSEDSTGLAERWDGELECSPATDPAGPAGLFDEPAGPTLSALTPEQQLAHDFHSQYGPSPHQRYMEATTKGQQFQFWDPNSSEQVSYERAFAAYRALRVVGEIQAQSGLLDEIARRFVGALVGTAEAAPSFSADLQPQGGFPVTPEGQLVHAATQRALQELQSNPQAFLLRNLSEGQRQFGAAEIALARIAVGTALHNRVGRLVGGLPDLEWAGRSNSSYDYRGGATAPGVGPRELGDLTSSNPRTIYLHQRRSPALNTLVTYTISPSDFAGLHRTLQVETGRFGGWGEFQRLRSGPRPAPASRMPPRG